VVSRGLICLEREWGERRSRVYLVVVAGEEYRQYALNEALIEMHGKVKVIERERVKSSRETVRY
jgi:hypothetical protein